MTNFKALLCDVDGTMVLSEARNRAVISHLIGSNGGTIGKEDWVFLAGIPEAQIWDYVHERQPALAISREDFIKSCHDLCLKDEFNVAARPGMAEVLAYAREQGIAVASVTNSPRDVAEHSLRSTGLDGPLLFLLSATEVKAAGRALKPAPDPYLMAAEKLGVAPEDCLVLEDSYAGVTAAKAAGMTVLQLCDEGSPQHPAADYHVHVTNTFESVGRSLIAPRPPQP